MAEIALTADLALQLRDGCALARVAALSRHEALLAALRAIEGQLARSSNLGDWVALAIERVEGAREDLDDLFLDYRAFADVLRLEPESRLPHAAFKRALRDRGFAFAQAERGRLLCHGVRLRVWAAQVPIARAPVDLSAFLAACCQRDHGARVRSTELHRSYCAWAGANGAQVLSQRRFGEALRTAGFDRYTSNGVFWRGLTLLAPAPPADTELPSNRKSAAKSGAKRAQSPGLPGL